MPILPPELQRQIFEVAVRSNRYDTTLKLNLSLTARHVRTWVDWVYYELVAIQDDHDVNRFLKLAKLKEPVFFNVNVKTLIFSGSIPAESAAQILSLCSGIRAMSFWIFNPLQSLVLQLRQLSLSRLFTRCNHFMQLLSLDPSPWLSVTHLELAIQTVDQTHGFQHLTQLPSLTHVLLAQAHSPSAAKMVCQSCPSLQILLIVYYSFPHVDAIGLYSFDPRIVVGPLFTDLVRDWKGVHDIWADAERVLAKQIISQQQKASSSS
ncbi:hypothetical protein R3P38DRAFT_3164732 [Favolaschia claudopus]|uniref:Uncharacterized protein n=1 Tax=Favolaschia claudopus TaxID=2862362 RepID=A0AAW0EFK5_9AGAR